MKNEGDLEMVIKKKTNTIKSASAKSANNSNNNGTVHSVVNWIEDLFGIKDSKHSYAEHKPSKKAAVKTAKKTSAKNNSRKKIASSTKINKAKTTTTNKRAKLAKRRK